MIGVMSMRNCGILSDEVQIYRETDETLRKEMCQILLDLARADKKKFKAAVKDGNKKWAKKLIDLCKELEVE